MLDMLLILCYAYIYNDLWETINVIDSFMPRTHRNNIVSCVAMKITIIIIIIIIVYIITMLTIRQTDRQTDTHIYIYIYIYIRTHAHIFLHIPHKNIRAHPF